MYSPYFSQNRLNKFFLSLKQNGLKKTLVLVKKKIERKINLKKIQIKKDIAKKKYSYVDFIINGKKYFDNEYYYENYSDVKNAGIDALEHYLQTGWKEGRNPSEYFDTNFYIRRYSDVKNAEICPLVHYIEAGVFEKRIPASTKDYLNLKISKQEIKKQKKYFFKNEPLFSILVPLYNTEKKILTEMINSVLNQTYQNWELCLADGSDLSHEYIPEVVHSFIQKSNKIKYIKLKQNLGIAGNTIQAFNLSIGDYIILLDHDDLLTLNALYEVVCVIEKNSDIDFIYSDKAVFSHETGEILAYHYLPRFSPDLLRSCNYASHLTVFSKKVIEYVGFIRDGFDGSQDYDLELRVIEKARLVSSIQKVLYYSRACEGSVALNPLNKMYAYEAGRKAIYEHIKRIGYPGTVKFDIKTFSYRIYYDIKAKDKVCIIIPNKDHMTDLRRCIESVITKTDYENYEIIIVENNSVENETFEYYQQLLRHVNIKILKYEKKGFNFSAINNFAVSKLHECKYILFLNNDTEIIQKNWLSEMIMLCQRDDVGAVGAKLYYPNDTIQHSGLYIGLGNHIASNFDHGKNRYNTGYMHKLSMVQNISAVTAACMLIKKNDFDAVGGFDEYDYKVSLNDMDLCLKLIELGKKNVITPYAELYHFESLSRDSDMIGENKIRFDHECHIFRRKWEKYFQQTDWYMNQNFINVESI